MYFPAKIRENAKLIESCIKLIGTVNVSLAGGCIRDALFDKDVRDVDVYCLTPFGGEQYARLANGNMVVRQGNPASATDDDADTIEVFRHIDHPNCDIILINKEKYISIADYIADKFDCSICQVWYNFEYGLGSTTAFKVGRTEKKNFWFKRHMNRLTYANHRQRVESKYRDWEHINV